MGKQTVSMKVSHAQFGRGELGTEFHSATYRFPLKDAQRFERRAIANGLTRATLLQQLVRGYNAATPDPGKSVKAEATAHATVWGAAAKKAKKTKASKKAKKTKASKASKTAKTVKAVKAEKSTKRVTSLGSALSRLAARRAA